jgi:hypothetical protein
VHNSVCRKTGDHDELSEIAFDRTDPMRGPVRLVWLQRLFYEDQRWDRPPALLTIHEVSVWNQDPVYECSAYTLTRAGPRLDARVGLGSGSWSAPTVFADAGDTFALFTTECGGSSTYRTYALIHLGQDGAREVPIEHPLDPLGHLLGPGQHSEPARTWIGESPDGVPPLRFEFSIWNQDESNNFPTGGSVSGTMRVQRDAAGRPQSLAVETWEQTKPDRAGAP